MKALAQETLLSYPCKILALLCLYLVPAFAVAQDKIIKTWKYEEFLKPLDIYRAPEGYKILKINNVYDLLMKNGLPIRQAKEGRRGAEKTYEQFHNNLMPKVSINTGQTLSSSSQTLSTVDSQGNETEAIISSESRGKNLNLQTSGELPLGVSWLVNAPVLSENDTSTTGSLSYSLSMQLLKGSVFTDSFKKWTMADLDRRSGMLNQKAAVFKALLEAQSRFYDLALSELSLRVQRNDIKSREALFDDLITQLKLGEIDELSVLRSEVELSKAQIQLATTENALSTARLKFFEYLNLTQKELSGLYPDFGELKSFPKQPDMDIDKFLKQALDSRPDYLLSRIKLRKAEIETEIAKSNRLPTLTLKYDRNLSASDEDSSWKAFEDARKFKNRQDTVSLNLSYVIYNNPTFEQHEQILINKSTADWGLKILKNEIQREIKSTHFSLINGYKTLELSDRSLALSRREMESEFFKFRIGESSIRDLTDVQKELNSSLLENFKQRVKLRQLITEWNIALGVLPEGVSFTEASF